MSNKYTPENRELQAELEDIAVTILDGYEQLLYITQREEIKGSSLVILKNIANQIDESLDMLDIAGKYIVGEVDDCALRDEKFLKYAIQASILTLDNEHVFYLYATDRRPTDDDLAEAKFYLETQYDLKDLMKIIEIKEASQEVITSYYVNQENYRKYGHYYINPRTFLHI